MRLVAGSIPAGGTTPTDIVLPLGVPGGAHRAMSVAVNAQSDALPLRAGTAVNAITPRRGSEPATATTNQPSLLNVMRRIHGGKAQIVLVFSGRETDGFRMNGMDANK